MILTTSLVNKIGRYYIELSPLTKQKATLNKIKSH